MNRDELLALARLGTRRNVWFERSIARWLLGTDTLAHRAVRLDAGDIIELLHARGFDCDLESRRAGTPLELASKTASVETIRALLNAGAQVEGGRQRGVLKPLVGACFSRRIEVVELLLSAGADPMVVLDRPLASVARIRSDILAALANAAEKQQKRVSDEVVRLLR